MFIALTEIRRSLGRFGLLTSAVALLVLLLLFFQAVAGTLTSGLTGGFASTRAEVLVYDERARLNPQASVLDPAVADDVAEVEGVTAATPIGVGVFTGTTPRPTGGERQFDLAIVGADADGAAGPRDLTDGRRAEADGEAVYSGNGFDADVPIGDVVEVGDLRLEVVGTAPDAAVNLLPTFYVPFVTYEAAVQQRVGQPIPAPASVIGVTGADGSDPVAVADAITGAVPGVEAVDRATAVDALPGVGQITQSFSILYLLLYVVVTIVTGVFFLILTVQKADALVLLRAVGANRRDVVRPVLLQVVLIVGIGAVVGAAVASGLLYAARDTFGAAVSPTTAAVTVVAILALGLIASLGAIRRVLAIDPSTAVGQGGI